MKICKVITCFILITLFLCCSSINVYAEEKATESTSVIQQVEEATANEITSTENTEKQIKEIQEILLYILAILFFFAIVLIFKILYNYLDIFF